MIVRLVVSQLDFVTHTSKRRTIPPLFSISNYHPVLTKYVKTEKKFCGKVRPVLLLHHSLIVSQLNLSHINACTQSNRLLQTLINQLAPSQYK